MNEGHYHFTLNKIFPLNTSIKEFVGLLTMPKIDLLCIKIGNL
jgi:hypothetical protein